VLGILGEGELDRREALAHQAVAPVSAQQLGQAG
jgi:hypothetical protein